MLKDQPLWVPAIHHHSRVIHGQVSDKPHCCMAQPGQGKVTRLITTSYSQPPFDPSPPETKLLLLRSLNDQVHSEPIFDPMLIQRVSILQDLPSKDQNQLILFGFKPSRNLFFELKNKQSIFQAKA